MQLFKLSTYILISICVSFADDCNTYTTSADCPSDHCDWDPNVGTEGECHQEGPPDCINDCVIKINLSWNSEKLISNSDFFKIFLYIVSDFKRFKDI